MKFKIKRTHSTKVQEEVWEDKIVEHEVEPFALFKYGIENVQLNQFGKEVFVFIIPFAVLAFSITLLLN